MKLVLGAAVVELRVEEALKKKNQNQEEKFLNRGKKGDNTTTVSEETLVYIKKV